MYAVPIVTCGTRHLVPQAVGLIAPMVPTGIVARRRETKLGDVGNSLNPTGKATSEVVRAFQTRAKRVLPPARKLKALFKIFGKKAHPYF